MKCLKPRWKFLNEFTVNTDYNNVGSTEKMVIKTELDYVGEKDGKQKTYMLFNTYITTYTYYLIQYSWNNIRHKRNLILLHKKK
jgi:hypothetical protein